MKKIHTPEEGQELFEQLSQVQDPDILDAIFRSGWAQSGDENLGHLLSWEQLKQELDNRITRESTQTKSRSLNLWKWGVAASILAIASFVWWFTPGVPEQVTYQTGFGQTQEILLDDGTTVILNANSSLVWHQDLHQDATGSEYRLAELSGEAFFEVSQVNEEGKLSEDTEGKTEDLVPFKVRTSELTVNVLGTAFNLSSRRGITDVYLDHGAVQLELMKKESTSAALNQKPTERTYLDEPVMMHPGDMVSFSSATQDLQKKEAENPDQYTEWKAGTLVFDNVTLGEMLERLEDIYGKAFYVQDTLLLQTPVSAGLPYKNWETVTKLLEVSLNVKLKEDQNNIVRLEKRKG